MLLLVGNVLLLFGVLSQCKHLPAAPICPAVSKIHFVVLFFAVVSVALNFPLNMNQGFRKNLQKPSRTRTSREAWASVADPANSTRADCDWLVLISLESQLAGLARPQSARPLHALMNLESRLLHTRQMPHVRACTRARARTHSCANTQILDKCLHMYTISSHKVLIIWVCMCVGGTLDAAN